MPSKNQDYSIRVKDLKRYFEVSKKDPGLRGSIKGIFSRKKINVKAVDNVSFEIGQGELVGFIGPNGAGKTTTLKMLSGVLHPTEGVVTIGEFIPFERKEDFLKTISLVMGQKSQLWRDLPVIETLNLHKEIFDVSDEDYKGVLDELSELLEVKDLLSTQVRKLSLGQKMKCELIASLIHTPKILFLDEPTIGLDVVMQKNLRKFIKEYNKRHNATVILTSHYMDDVKEICDRIIMINKGEIVFDGSIEHLIEKYAGHKNLVVILNNKIDEKALSEIEQKVGKINTETDLKISAKVNRDKVASVTAYLLEKLDVDDIDINEPKLEDIISSLF